MRILLTIPAYNEELVLPHTLPALAAYFGACEEVKIVVADNASTDKTAEVIQLFAEKNPKFLYISVPEKGKGNAIKSVFSSFDADIYAFMDADLATDLSAWPKLLEQLHASDMAIGSRFLSDSVVKQRSWKRSVFSFGNKVLLQKLFHTSVTDFACGFKAFKRNVIQKILPQVQNKQWFFDVELVLRAQHAGFSVSEVPVTWKEDVFGVGRVSKTRMVNAFQNWKEIQRLKKELA